MKIINFVNEYDFLNNGYPCLISYNDEFYPSVEHAFQALKTNDPDLKLKISQATTAHEAKKIGRKIKDIIPNWDNKKLSYMEELIQFKFENNLDLKIKLLLTNGKEICPEINDVFWKKHLGLILMKVRDNFLKLETPGLIFSNFLKTYNLDFINQEIISAIGQNSSWLSNV